MAYIWAFWQPQISGRKASEYVYVLSISEPLYMASLIILLRLISIGPILGVSELHFASAEVTILELNQWICAQWENDIGTWRRARNLVLKGRQIPIAQESATYN